MFAEIARDAEVLSNAKAGWVNRRDAAERLGEAAALALKTLHAHRADPDVDVRPSIEKALSRAKQQLEGVASCSHTLQELAHACSKPGERTVVPQGDMYEIEVNVKDGRRQKVFVSQYTNKDGVKFVRVLTRCGRPTPKSIEWALQINEQLSRGALAVRGEGDSKELVLLNTLPMDGATLEAVKAAVKEAAYYGDWVESKLSGKDEL